MGTTEETWDTLLKKYRGFRRMDRRVHHPEDYWRSMACQSPRRMDLSCRWSLKNFTSVWR